MKKIISFARPHLGWLVSGIVCTLIGVTAAMFPPVFARRIVDEVFVPVAASSVSADTQRLLIALVSGIAAATLVRAGGILSKNLFLETFSQRALRDLRCRVYDHIQTLSFDFFHNTRTGELMARMTGDMEAVRLFLVLGAMHGATAVFYFLVSSTILFSINWQLAFVAIAGSPFLLMFTLMLRRRIYPRFQAMRRQYSSLNTAVQENVSGIRVVKSLMRYDYELEKFRKENHKLTETRNEALVVWARFMPAIELLSGIAAALMLIAGGWMVINNRITLGVWVQFNGYLWMLVMPMRMLGEVVNSYSMAKASAERIGEILEVEPNIRNGQESVFPARSIRGEVELRGVTWRVDGRTILEGIDLHAKPGDTIAIMGPTGSGKSSIVHLIPRFYDPDEGCVLIDGMDVRTLDLDYLRLHIGLVAQETFLFSETMYNNLTYGKRGASPDFVKRVAVQTQAHEFIRSMSDGYETVVGERGVGLSGGQKQRASIARTLLKQAPILVLDDATSSVDMETERLIQDSLKRLEHRVTTFVVAHRISSVRHADEIVMLDHGRIVERGTHEQLLERGGEYAAVYEVQHGKS